MIRLGGPVLTESEGGPIPASLLLLSATGAPIPQFCGRSTATGCACGRGSSPESADAVDDADVVVIDATDSAIAGIDTLVSVRRQSGVPVVFLAGEGSGSEAVQALDLGADDFVIEPFVSGEVPARIRSVLRRCRRPGATGAAHLRSAVAVPRRTGGSCRRSRRRDHAAGVRSARLPRHRAAARLLPH